MWDERVSAYAHIFQGENSAKKKTNFKDILSDKKARKGTETVWWDANDAILKMKSLNKTSSKRTFGFDFLNSTLTYYTGKVGRDF